MKVKYSENQNKNLLKKFDEYTIKNNKDNKIKKLIEGILLFLPIIIAYDYHFIKSYLLFILIVILMEELFSLFREKKRCYILEKKYRVERFKCVQVSEEIKDGEYVFLAKLEGKKQLLKLDVVNPKDMVGKYIDIIYKIGLKNKTKKNNQRKNKQEILTVVEEVKE